MNRDKLYYKWVRNVRNIQAVAKTQLPSSQVSVVDLPVENPPVLQTALPAQDFILEYKGADFITFLDHKCDIWCDALKFFKFDEFKYYSGCATRFSASSYSLEEFQTIF